MARFEIKFTKKDEFERRYELDFKDETIAWEWSDKQKAAWKASGMDVKKMKVEIKPLTVAAMAVSDMAVTEAALRKHKNGRSRASK